METSKRAASRGRKPKQLELATVATVATKTHGGKRKGAGRPAADPRATRKNASHRRRPDHAARCPVHVTMRVAKGIPSLRCELVQNLLKQALKDQARRDYGAGFQIVHFSIQDDHLHLAVEANGVARIGLPIEKGRPAADAAASETFMAAFIASQKSGVAVQRELAKVMW